MLTRRRSLATLASLLPWLSSSASFAAQPQGDVDEALRELSKAREKLKTLVVGFSQERTLGLLAAAVSSKGELTLVRPDRMRYELLSPDPAVYWVGPEGVSYKTAQGSGKVDQRTAGPLHAVLDDMLTVLGGDLSKLSERYTMAVERPKDGGMQLSLSPKSERVAKLVRRIEVTLGKDLLSPRKLRLLEQGDDQTTVQFDEARLNVPVDAAKMKP